MIVSLWWLIAVELCGSTMVFTGLKFSHCLNMFPAIFKNGRKHQGIKDDFVPLFSRENHGQRFQFAASMKTNQVASSSVGGWTIETFNQPLC